MQVGEQAGAGASHCCTRCQTSGLETKLLLCGKCRQARYCSRDCQKADWPAHKAACKTAVVEAAAAEPAAPAPAAPAPAAHKKQRHVIDGRKFWGSGRPTSQWMPALRKTLEDAVMPAGAQPVKLGSVCMAQAMVNDETQTGYPADAEEFWVGFYDIEPKTRLPSPYARATIRITHLSNGNFMEELAACLTNAHQHMGAVNPFVVRMVELRDNRTSSAKCECSASSCDNYMFNGPHANPSIRANGWNQKKLVYTS